MIKRIGSSKHGRIFVVLYLTIFGMGCQDDIIKRDSDYVAVFQSFWEIMDEKYVFFDEKNVDWDLIYKQYMPKFESDTSVRNARLLFQEITDTLNDGHIWIIADDFMLRNEEKDKILDISFDKVYKRYGLYNYKEHNSVNIGQFPERITYISVLEGIADISFTHLNIDNYDYTNGLIFDLRACRGGYGSGIKIIDGFIHKRTKVFYVQYKDGNGHDDFTKLFTEYINGKGILSPKIPVVVLINRNTFSTGNIIASILKDIGNATLVGEKTGGGGGSVNSVFLPNGWGLSYPENRIYNLSGELIEGGVEPNVEVLVDDNFWKNSHQDTGEDPQMEKAFEILKKPK